MKFLKNITKDTPNIGNKSMNLALLQTQNFNVANGIVLSENEIKNPSYIKLLKPSFENMAVRSAAIGEDGELSFAGIFKTVLNVQQEDLEEAIEAVTQSFVSRRAQVYQELKKTSVIPQILIQEMIPSKYSIVAFVEQTSMTLSGIKGECEQIVSGKGEAQEMTVLEDGKIVGAWPTNVDLTTLISELERMRKLYDYDLDVEATYDGKKWWILQARKLNKAVK